MTRINQAIILITPLEPRRLLSTLAHAQDNDLDYDTAGRLHFAYFDAAERSLNYMLRDIGGQWSAPSTIDDSADVGRYVSLEIDPQGNPGLAYFDATAADLKYAHHDDGNWNVTRVDAAGRVGLYPSLAYRANGTPLITYYDKTRGDLRLAENVGSTWSIQTIDAAGDVGRHTSLEIDPATGKWIVAYDRTSDGAVLVTRQKRDALLRKVIDKSPRGAAFLSLAIDPSGLPALSYYQASDRDLRFANFDGSAWHTTTVASQGTQGLGSNLLFDGGGRATIVHYNQSSDTIDLATDSGSSWQLLTVTAGGSAWVRAAQFNDAPISLSVPMPGNDELIIGQLPDAPQDVTASAASDSAIDIAWTSDATDVDSFVVERASSGHDWTTVGEVDSSTTQFTDTPLPEGASYQYRVRAVGEVGTSAASETAPATTLPIAPDALVTTSISASRIDLAWSDNSSVETGFVVERSTDGVNFTPIAVALPNSTGHIDSGLLEATQYSYRVRALAGTVESAASVASAAITRPAAPSGLLGQVVSPDQVDLSWSDNSAGENGFVVQRSLDGIAFADVATLGAGVETYTDSGLSESIQYTYRVRAFNSAGNSAPSATASPTTLPAAPSGLSTVVISAAQVDLSWSDNSGGEQGFIVERSTDGGPWIDVVIVSANVTTYSDGGLSEATGYAYRVRAFNGTGDSTRSGSASATTVPAAPSSLTATTIAYDQVDLSWTDHSAGESGYIVARSIDGVAFTDIATLGANVTAFSDNALNEATQYTYRTRAFNASGSSAIPAPATATTYPAAPTGLGAFVISTGQIDLAWTDNSGGEQGYIVARSTDGGPWVDVAIVSTDVTSHSDGGLTEATDYAYRVRAFNGSGDSAQSSSATRTTLPAAPSSLSAATVSDEQIDLSWSDHSAGEDGFIVARSDDGIAFVDVATLGPNVGSYSDVTLDEATEYTYRVRVFNATGDSMVPAPAAATTLPASPSALAAAPVSATRIDLIWSDNSGGESGYEVDRSPDGSTWSQLATLPANAASYSDTTAADGSISYYRLRAAGAAGPSEYSAAGSATTVPLAPASVSAAAVSLSQVDLSWGDVTGESGFEVERSNDGVSYSLRTSTAAGIATFSDTGLAEGVPYYYRVRATNASGYSTYSTAANATTPGSSSGAIHAHFSGGNGVASSDQFAGVAGNGWSNAWQTTASTSTLTTTVKSYGDAGYSPVNARGKYLDVNATQTGGGSSNPAVGRQYTSFGGVTRTAVHVIRFDLRVDTLGTFTNANDRITIVDTTVLTTGGTANSTWEIRGYGANTGTATAGKWSFCNGIRNGEGSAKNNRWVSSTMNVVAGTTYSFTVTTNPVTRSWDVSIAASDGQTAVNSSNLGYRTTATTARGFVSYSVRTNAAAEPRDISIDSVTVDLT